MKILALLTPAAGTGPADFQPHMLAEEKAVWTAYRAGVLREMHFQPEPLVVSLVLEAASHTEAQAVLAGFPMVEAGLLDIRLVTLGPFAPLEGLFDLANRT